MDVLEKIVAHKRIEVENFKKVFPESSLHARVESLMNTQDAIENVSMRKAIVESPTGIIALSYQQNGAAAISILTDDEFFGGSDKFIVKARQSGVTIPVLYKNFVIDEYQLFQARLCGASAVLLIAAELSKQECRTLLHTAHELQLEVLLEMHSELELEYAELEPDLCGINNRNLGTFITSVDNSFRLASMLPKEAVKVSESGISNPQTIRQLMQAGFNGFLIGECFMKEFNPGEALAKFIAEI